MERKKQKTAGKTKDAGFQVGARKTIPVEPVDAWQYLTAGEGLTLWLGDITAQALSEGTRYRLSDGTKGKVRVFSDSHLRMSWHPPDWPRPSTIQVRVIPKDDRSIIAFHQEHLPGPTERERRKQFFKEVLNKLYEKFSG